MVRENLSPSHHLRLPPIILRMLYLSVIVVDISLVVREVEQLFIDVCIFLVGWFFMTFLFFWRVWGHFLKSCLCIRDISSFSVIYTGNISSQSVTWLLTLIIFSLSIQKLWVFGITTSEGYCLSDLKMYDKDIEIKTTLLWCENRQKSH